MANYQAIKAVCCAVVQLLKTNYRPEDFSGTLLDFRVGLLTGSQVMNSGVSLSVYRITPNATNRIPAGRVNPDGSRTRSPVFVDMHFILTAFGKDPLLQLTIAGWMMRLLEDNPVLPSPLMNVDNKDVFKQDESVDIIAEVLTNDELFRIWGELTDEPYQISVPYLARNIVIDSGTQANVVTPIISRTIQRNVSP